MISQQEIKSRIKPLDYYNNELNGRLGKATGDGWYAWNGLCPFHADRHAGSFVVNSKTGAFKCFSCGYSGGDILNFHMKKYGLDFKQAVQDLEARL